MNKILNKLTRAVREFTVKNGENQTALPFLKTYRFTNSIIQMPQTETPYIYLVLDGSIRLHTPSGIMDYISGQYSVSAIDTPISGNVLTFSDEQDFLALSVTITLDDVLSVILDLDDDLTVQIAEGTVDDSMIDEVEQRIIDIAYNLICALNRPAGLGFMGKHMKQNYRNSFTVENLAEKHSMSVSYLHQKFKSAVGMGVLQCQKRLRLTEARRLMLDESKNVTEAAFDVGYESVSQFIREYRKMFGKSPKEDISIIQKRLKK